MAEFDGIKNCREITRVHAKRAASSPALMRELLARVGAVASPAQKCVNVFLAFAYLADADWVDGELRVEVMGDKVRSTIAVFCDLGGGMRERLLPSTMVKVPIDELEKELTQSAATFSPLQAKRDGTKLVIVKSGRAASGPPPEIEIEIDEQSLREEPPETVRQPNPGSLPKVGAVARIPQSSPNVMAAPKVPQSSPRIPVPQRSEPRIPAPPPVARSEPRIPVPPRSEPKIPAGVGAAAKAPQEKETAPPPPNAPDPKAMPAPDRPTVHNRPTRQMAAIDPELLKRLKDKS